MTNKAPSPYDSASIFRSLAPLTEMRLCKIDHFPSLSTDTLLELRTLAREAQRRRAWEAPPAFPADTIENGQAELEEILRAGIERVRSRPKRRPPRFPSRLCEVGHAKPPIVAALSLLR
jgi:hypothetical protein